MRAGPTSITVVAAALAIGLALLTGCGPTGTDSETLTPDVVPVNPELATLPDIEVIPDISYGADPAQRLDACLPPDDDGPVQNAVDSDDPAGPELDDPASPARAAIVVVHGGSWSRGDKTDIAWRAVCQWLASAGYVTLSINYRLAPANIFPAAIDDVQAAVAWLREDDQVGRFDIDPDRIGAFGGSAGGNLVALLGTRGSGDLTSGSRVAAVVDMSGPIDLTGLAVTDDFIPVQLAYLGCATEEDCPAAVAASPFYAIDQTDPPFFVAHSTAEMIPLAQSEILVAGLRAAGASVEFVTVEGTLHSIAMLDGDLKARIVDFLDGTIGVPETLSSATARGEDGDMSEPQAGATANGVPYLVVPAASTDAPVVVIWHLLDPPRTPVAMQAAIPLAGLDATKLYLGLPMSGSRTPDGGVDAIMGMLADDAPLRVHGPIWQQAVAEFPAAFAELRERFGVAQDAAVGLVGGSMGSAVAAGVLAAGTSGGRVAVLLSPMLSLRAMIDSVSPQFGGYTWSPESDAVAARMDFLARAGEVTAGDPAIRIVAGSDDDEQGFLVVAREFAATTGADLHELSGVGHALAEEPGVDAAPQTDGAKRADALAADWLRENLT